MLSIDRFVIRFGILSEAWHITSELGLMIVVTAEMSPRHDVIGSNDGRAPSQPDERTRNVLDPTQALEAVASRLGEALVNVREKELQVEARVALSRSSISIFSQCLRGT